MIVWRLGRAAHDPLDGEGARRVSGRWNPRGVPVVYTSEHLSLALLELLVHLDSDLLPADLTAFRIDVADAVAIERQPPDALPADWRAVPAPASTQAIGAAWAGDPAHRAAVLAVPSVVIPEERNFLLNPAHRDARRWRVVSRAPFALDPRLFG